MLFKRPATIAFFWKWQRHLLITLFCKFSAVNAQNLDLHTQILWFFNGIKIEFNSIFKILIKSRMLQKFLYFFYLIVTSDLNYFQYTFKFRNWKYFCAGNWKNLVIYLHFAFAMQCIVLQFFLVISFILAILIFFLKLFNICLESKLWTHFRTF